MRALSLLILFVLVGMPLPASVDTVLIPGGEGTPIVSVPEGIDIPDDLGGSAICWRDGSGFVFRFPDDWRPAKEEAARFGLCAMAFWNGTNFHDATAVMYPQTFALRPGQTPENAADNAAELVRREFARLPGGEAVSIRTGETITTTEDLRAEIRFFDNGPPPTKFEAAAYIVYEGIVFSVVLSAQTPEGRDRAMPGFRDTINKIIPLRVTFADRPEEAETANTPAK